MHNILLLVAALAGGNWSCSESDGLWDCRPTRPLPAARRAAPPAQPQLPAATSFDSPPPAQPRQQAAPSASAGPVPQQAADVSQSVTPAPRPPGQAPAQPDFVVQIGAYENREGAERAAAALGDAGLTVVPTLRDGKTWYVLLLGAFLSLDAARAAGDSYEARTGGSYWVRTMADLEQALPKTQPPT